MSTDNPLNTFTQLVAALSSLMESDSVFAERVQRQAELYKEMAISEPDSLRRELVRLHAQPGVSPDLPRLLFEMAQRVPPDPNVDFSYFEPAHEFFHFLSRAAERTSMAAVRDLLADSLCFDVPVRRAALAEAMRPAANVSFERRVRTLAEVLRETAEDWYRSILRTALTVSFQTRGRHDAVVPFELGGLMDLCRDSNDVPLTMLRRELRMIRNATAHSLLEFDLDAERVTFVNVTRRGVREELGPLSWTELWGIGDSLLYHCCALTLVLKRQRRLMTEAAA